MNPRRAAAACLVALPMLGLPGAGHSPAPLPAVEAPRPSPPPDVFFLVNGDRVSGSTLSSSRRRFVVRTPYGSVTLPRQQVVRIVHGDGREEVLQPEAVAPEPSPTPEPPPPSTAELTLVFRGGSFWYAWDRRTVAVTALRLQLSLDERELAVYTDTTLDPQDLPGATVNTFRFDTGMLHVTAAEGVSASLPVTRPGRAVIRLTLPVPPAPVRPYRLRLAYQLDTGGGEEPAWRDIVDTALDVHLPPGAAALVEVRQDPGRTEFSGLAGLAGLGRQSMKHLDTFRLEARTELDSPAPES